MVTHVALNHADADDWDLEFWQQQTPEQRLDALILMREEVAMIHAAKKKKGR